MNLTKSDKMIAIIGVVILIVAAVGIVYYYWTYEEPEEVEIEPTMKTYKVTWATDSGNLLVGEGIWVDKKGAYNELVEVSVIDYPGSILTDVDFTISWQDDKTFGIGRRIFPALTRGKDTLSASISPMENGQPIEQSSTWGGEMPFSFDVNEMPSELYIEAEDEWDAVDQVRAMYTELDSASYDVTVTVKIGEKPRRLLKYISDKGNDFTLNATYNYCYPLIEEIPPEDGGSDGDEGNGDDTTTGGSNGFLGLCRNNIINLCYGKGWV